MRILRTVARPAIPAMAALMLAACGGAEEETTLETDVEDLSGGDFIVTEEDPDAVPVDLPETPMTPVPEDEVPTDDETGTPATDQE